MVTVADGFDLAGPAAEVVLAVMAWAAKMERLAINERIAAARERLAEEGRPWGRPSRITPIIREQVMRLRAEGRSIREVAVADKDSRVVPILDALLPVLKAWKLQTGCEGRVVPPLRVDGEKVDKHTPGSFIRPVLAGLGLHALATHKKAWYCATRHTFAS